MPDDHSNEALGDMLVGLVGELDERLSLDPQQRNLVVLAITIAANNGRVIGAREMVAQAIQMGYDLNLEMVPGPQAAQTIADYLNQRDEPA